MKRKFLKSFITFFLILSFSILAVSCASSSSLSSSNISSVTSSQTSTEGSSSSSQESVSNVTSSEVSSEQSSSSEIIFSSSSSSSSSEPIECNHELGEAEVYVPATLEKGGQLIKRCIHCNTYSETEEYSIINNKENGADKVYLSRQVEDYSIAVSYTLESFVFTINTNDVFDNEILYLYINANGATELLDGRAYRLIANVSSYQTSYASYSGYSDYLNTFEPMGLNFIVNHKEVEIKIPYAVLGSDYATSCGKNLAFYPEIAVGQETISYSQNNSFIIKHYAETWLSVNQNGKIYYDTTYQNRHIENWTRPSFANHDSMFVGVIKESTIESAIVAIAISEAKGASGFDLHLNYLFNNNLLTKENVEKIAHSTSKPILALNYNGNIPHTDRTDGLLIGVQGGCAAVDMQGYIYWSGSTLDTHTSENVAYWEGLGYDMSFIKASPKETVLDRETVAKQVEFVNQVHDLGAEVLLSAHINTVFDSKQAVAFAEFCAGRGVDIVKIVGIGYTKMDVEECVQACIDFKKSEKLANKKVSFHLSGEAGVYITRVVCPSFFGSYVAFCYPELTAGQDGNQLDLDMAVECREIAKNLGTPNITLEQALLILKQNCVHPQFVRLLNYYENASSIVKRAPGGSSDMGDRWTINGENYYIGLRDASGTSSFNIRPYAYDSDIKANDMWISADITANMSPYASSSGDSVVRAPKVGVFIGNQDSMLAFVYYTKTRTIDLTYLTNGSFGYDSPKGDRLFTTGLINNGGYNTDVANGGTIRMAIHKTETTIELYFAEGTNKYYKVATIEITKDILGMFTNDNGVCRAGVLAEVYMGSDSVGKVNSISYKVSYKQVTDITTERTLNIVGYAYGGSSDMSNRWSINGSDCDIQLRDAEGTNSFNIRSYAYDSTICEKDMWISASITANMSPYVASNRVPKVGVYIGTKDKMLAFVYNTNTKTIDLVCTTDNDFGYDSPKGDRLSTTGLIENTAYNTDVAGGGTIRMAIHKTETVIELYFAEGTNDYVKVATLDLTQDLLALFDNNNGACYGGILAETYMGSSSVGKVNSISYKVSYNEI